MSNTTLKIEKSKLRFVPENLNINWETIAPLFQKLEAQTLNNVSELQEWLQNRSELEAVLEEEFAWRYIKMTCNTADKKLLEDFQYYTTEIEPKIAPYNNSLNQKFINCPFIDELPKDKFQIYIRGIKNALEIYRDENIPLLTEIQIKQQQYQEITSAMSITIDDKIYTLSQAAVFLKSTDRNVRETTWKQIQERRLVDKSKLDNLFDKLVQLRHQVALNAGFENFRDYMFRALGRFDYEPKDCYNFHESIQKNVVPVLKEQALQKATKLNLEQLKPWDTEVDPDGNSALKPFENGNELIEKSISCFNAISPELGEKIQIMQENALFDVESRIGKAPGGYNYPLARTGAPFIFMNSANTLRDLTTMVHEGGHAIHTFLTANLELNDFKHCPSEVAELASMSMELISMDYWDCYFSNASDLKRAKLEQLSDVLKTLPWVAVIDQFQHWIYTNPHHNASQRDEAFEQIFALFGSNFCDWSQHQDTLKNLWQKQLHIFEVPFYYIEYGMAQLGAIAVWKNYKENPKIGLENYLNALKLGYTKSIIEIYETAGIKFDFSADYIKSLIEFINNEINKLHHD